MATFMVSLFGPNTVAFHPISENSSANNGSLTSKKESNQSVDYYNHKDQQHHVHGRSRSLTTMPTCTTLIHRETEAIGKTPGATTREEEVFRPNAGTVAYKLPLRDVALQRNKSAASLQTLASFDPQSVPWGKNFDMNQPKSQAKSPPSQSIFNENDVPKIVIDDTEPVFARQPNKQRPSRRTKDEVAYTVDNYTVQPTSMGNAGLFSAINATSTRQPFDKYWVSTLGMPTNALPEHVKSNIAEKFENHHETLVVFVDDTDMNACYESYCKDILWPMLHSQVPELPKSKMYQDKSWEHYKAVNKAFAEVVVQNYKDEDIVWVHDYHLFLVPQYVREHHPRAQIGLYCHSAFPPSEIFRCLPSRCELILGMLGANMIAFQNENYRYQFLQTCSRLLNVEGAEHGLVLDTGRFVDVFAIPMGIDIDTINIGRQLPEVKDRMKELSERFANKRLIVSRDKLDNVNGLKHKLRGYRDFLERYPRWRDKVVLVQIATSTTQDRELSDEVNRLITEINGNWGDLNYQPIVFLNRDIDFSQYVALLSIADCMFVTSLSEGMNLTCHEYVVCQDKMLNHKGHNPLLVSEFIGAASVFGHNAVQINPFHPKGIAESLAKALHMGPDEKDVRWDKMYALARKHSAQAWFDACMEGLSHAWKEHTLRDPATVPRLAVRDLQQKYNLSKKRLIIVDFEGTLTMWDSPKESVVTVPLKVIEALTNLVEDARNTVYVMSQQTADGLQHMFRLVPKLGLIAENGAFLRKPKSTVWTQVVGIDTSSWQKGVMVILKHFETSIPGSTTRELKTGIIFHYFDSEDQKDAAVKAGELANQINEMCENLGVSATPIEKGLYISPININKALATKAIESDLFRKNIPEPIDFVFVVGDSHEDECVFKWAHEQRGKVDAKNVITCVVGKRSTIASAALTQGTGAVVATLEKLALSRTAGAT